MMQPEKTILILSVVMAGLCAGQMPTGEVPTGGVPTEKNTTLPSSFDASGTGAKPQTDDPAHRGETPNPQLLGMEIPLMDPSTDTVKYNGGLFDVGNNAAVRARFEKFLEQPPDDTDESKRYRALIDEMLKATQRAGRDKQYAVGGKTLVKVGKGLYEASEYPGDGQQAGTLASAIVSALDVQRKAIDRDKQNQKLAQEVDELIREANRKENHNQVRREGRTIVTSKPGARGGGGGRVKLDGYRIAQIVKTTAKHEATQAANITANEAAFAAAKINYQALLVAMLVSRRFDHVVIGARIYRHIFRDGDTKMALDEDSKAYQLFNGNLGLPPTVNTLDSMASNARREVDQSIESVYGMLARNKLAQATQHLIEAVAIGEYMQSVATFPTEHRQRIAMYWNLRKRALTALNARDYATVEEVAAQMKEMDADFDDSMVLSYTSGKKRQSDFALRNARKALLSGDDAGFNKYIEEAGTIWPRNPNLKKGEDLITQFDEGDPVKEEFVRLYDGKDFRRIAREREHFKVVNTDPELAKKYEEVITLVMKMDGMLEQIKEVAQQDATMGPCIAYEKLVEWRNEDANFANDTEMTLAQREFEAKAHDFVQALENGKACEEREEYGSALSCYYRAQCEYPQSTLAREGIKRATEIIAGASFR